MAAGAPTSEQFAVMRDRLNAGTIMLSARCDEIVAFIRNAAAHEFSGQALADRLSHPKRIYTRSAIISLGKRVDPPIQFKGGPGHSTRREKRAASGNISTHHMRLQRVMEGKKDPSSVERIFVAQSVRTGTTSAKTRKVYAPSCVWAGCKAPPMAPGKPYCEHHHYRSGAVVKCETV